MAAFRSDTKNTQRAGVLDNLYAEFLERSTQRDSARISAPTKAQTTSIGPTDEDYASYVDPVSPRSWHAASDEWNGPICDRLKRQIVRRSKANKWSGGIRKYRVYSGETDTQTIFNRSQLFPDFDNTIFIREITIFNICSDCAAIPQHLSQWDRSLRNPYLKPQDLRDVIISVQPHTPHDIAFESAKNCAAANEFYRSAVDAFRNFHVRAIEFSTRLDYWIKIGRQRQNGLKELAEDVRVFHRIEDWSECLYLAEWLVREGMKHQLQGSL